MMREPSYVEDGGSAEERPGSRNLGELRFLWRYVRPYGLQVAGALASLTVAAATVLAMGFGLRKLVDEGFAEGNAELSSSWRRPATAASTWFPGSASGWSPICARPSSTT
jgi:hypothetical protein